MLDDSQINNLFIGQKDAIRGMIKNGEFEGAIAALSVVRDLWIAEDYAYKGREVSLAGMKAISAILDDIEHTNRKMEKAKLSNQWERFKLLLCEFTAAKMNGAI